MSQIIFHDGDKEVLTGSDRPLNYCFLTIFDKEQEIIFDGLDYGEIFNWGVADVISHLREQGINFPADLEERLTEHMGRKAGNEVFRYTA